jgi:hypothetical protein
MTIEEEQPHEAPTWGEIEELERVARQYLEATKHSYPEVFSLPLAHYEVAREMPEMAEKKELRCGSKACTDTDLVGAHGLDEMVCGRRAGHEGPHASTWRERALFRHGWRFASWPNHSELQA